MTGPTDNCFVNQSQGVTPGKSQVGNGTYTPSASKCFCQQIDIEFNGTKGAKASGGWDASCEGTTTVTTFNCNNNFQCVAVNNNSGKYKTKASCETACVEEEQSLCGEDCTSDAQCPNDHSCSEDGKCVLDTCAEDPSLCTPDLCTPKVACGETCTTNNQCPNDHTCSNSKCVLNSCVGNADCTNNGCKLPETAFGDKPYHYISVGLLFLLVGVLINKYGIVNNFTLKLLAPSRKEKDDKLSKFSKDREKFENRFDL